MHLVSGSCCSNSGATLQGSKSDMTHTTSWDIRPVFIFLLFGQCCRLEKAKVYTVKLKTCNCIVFCKFSTHKIIFFSKYQPFEFNNFANFSLDILTKQIIIKRKGVIRIRK